MLQVLRCSKSNIIVLCCVNHGLCLVSSFQCFFSPSKVHLQQRQGHSVGCKFRGRKQALTLFYCWDISAPKCEENTVQFNQNCSPHTNHKYLITKYAFRWNGMKPDFGWPQISFVHFMCYIRCVQLKAEGNKLRCCGSNSHRGLRTSQVCGATKQSLAPHVSLLLQLLKSRNEESNDEI